MKNLLDKYLTIKSGEPVNSDAMLKIWEQEKFSGKLSALFSKDRPIFKEKINYEEYFLERAFVSSLVHNDTMSQIENLLYEDTSWSVENISRLEFLRILNYGIWDNFEVLKTNCIKFPEELANKKISFKDTNKKITFSQNMKVTSLFKKICRHYEISPTDWLNEYSKMHQESLVQGELTFSVHPMDFITMSDNDNNWTSCLSINEGGSYGVAVPELITSSTAFLCYYTVKDFEVVPGIKWNSKIFRQLFFLTEEGLFSSLGYPYHSDSMTIKILETIKNKIGWDCKFLLSKHSYEEKYGNDLGVERDVYFSRKTLYCDMDSSSNETANFYAYFNKKKAEYEVDLSGPNICLQCGQVRRDPQATYNTSGKCYQLFCKECLSEEMKCHQCGKIERNYNLIEISDNIYVCKECFKFYVKSDITFEYIFFKEAYTFKMFHYYSGNIVLRFVEKCNTVCYEGYIDEAKSFKIIEIRPTTEGDLINVSR